MRTVLAPIEQCERLERVRDVDVAIIAPAVEVLGEAPLSRWLLAVACGVTRGLRTPDAVRAQTPALGLLLRLVIILLVQGHR
ncbi:hypothetical protein [Haloechinothrix sp. LS1_15]|uniref:hypothetical protein n=1 Tax=Haloechinothrix sp. LS1_15 TaxID=2652248 RepID=UPI002947DE1D|nr:hypothetical protein [Haloechinothrix sp. LS1_15]MDV6011649.1 hypothetical protein [Haloechinothrix sp. LS1_15]